MILPPSIRADGKSYKPHNHCDALFEPGHKLPPAPAWLLFLVIFSKRQRDEYAKVGVTGAELLPAYAHPSEWVRLADEACGKAWGGKQFALGQPLDRRARIASSTTSAQGLITSLRQYRRPATVSKSAR